MLELLRLYKSALWTPDRASIAAACWDRFAAKYPHAERAEHDKDATTEFHAHATRVRRPPPLLLQAQLA